MGLYVAAYDISEGWRRDRVARYLESVGRRVQRSVFEIVIAPDDLDRFCFDVGKHLARSDHFDLYPIDQRRPRARRRWRRPIRRAPLPVAVLSPALAAEYDPAHPLRVP